MDRHVYVTELFLPFIVLAHVPNSISVRDKGEEKLSETIILKMRFKAFGVCMIRLIIEPLVRVAGIIPPVLEKMPQK